jgi:ketosteroid isomerase-like protein
MSQENVELHYRANDAFNRRDLDALLALTDTGVEFIPYEVAVQGGDAYRGHDGVRRWWEETFEVLPDISVDTDEVRALGENVTFAQGELHGTGAGSGASFQRMLWQVAEWRDRKNIWWRAFESEAEALGAARTRAWPRLPG